MRTGRRGLTIDYRALYDRYLAGESGVAIAADVGIHFTLLYRMWKRLGLPRRSVREAAQRNADRDPAAASRWIERATEVRRGGHDTLATKERRALTRERRGLGISGQERELAERLRAEGHAVRQQMAVGPYNVDLVIEATRLVIEVDGGGHSKRSREMAGERRAYIEARGWTVLHVWAKTRTVGWQDRAMDAVHASIGTQSSVPLG